MSDTVLGAHVDKVWSGEGREPPPAEGVAKHGLDTKPVRLLLPGTLVLLQLFYTLQTHSNIITNIFISTLQLQVLQ